MIAIHKKFSPLNPTNINWNGTSKLSTVVLFIKVSEAKWERFVRHMSISFCVEVTEFLKKIFRVVLSESFTIENPRIECFGVLYQWAFVVITLILVVDMTKYLATLHFKTCHDLFIKNQNSKFLWETTRAKSCFHNPSSFKHKQSLRFSCPQVYSH